MPRRATRQLEMELPPPRSWGGRRKGAGRKRSKSSGVPHLRRPALAARFPVHVTLTVLRELRSLRTKKRAQVMRKVFVLACRRDGFCIIDWSIQGDHLHLTVEAADGGALSRGIQGLSIRIARGLNNLCGRRGAVFSDRYHARILKTPREVRHARAYVLNNHHHHGADYGVRISAAPVDRFGVDSFSSWAWFDGWRELAPMDAVRAEREREGPAPVVPPQTWLMRVGWRRHGLVRIDEIPRPCR